MLLSLVLVLLLIVVVTVWIYRLANRNKKFFDNFNGPPPLPIIGNAFEAKYTTEILDVLLKFTKQYGDVFKVHIGPFKKALIVSDYKLLELVLGGNKILSKSEEYRYLHPWLGTGLLTSDGTKWKTRRKLLTPAFHFKILERYISVFETEGRKLVQKLEKEVGKASFDIYPYITLNTLDVICESAMGTSVNAQDNRDSIYVQSVKSMCKIVTERLFHLMQISEVTYPLTGNYHLQKKSLKVLHHHTNNVINDRRNFLQTQKRSTAFDERKEKKPFLDLLLEVSVDDKKLSQEEIREEVDTFMFEGHDTTASAISFALYALANHPHVQKIAYEEQLALYGTNKNPEVTYADLQSMKYLELVIKESLRLYPSVPFYGRQTTEEVACENGLVIPKNVTIMIFAFGIHRNPKYFPNPDVFDPLRFQSVDGTLPYAYIPFSAGPRNCIGQKFAMLEMKSTISRILRNFELSPTKPEHKLVLVPESILKSDSGIKIAINRRRTS